MTFFYFYCIGITLVLISYLLCEEKSNGNSWKLFFKTRKMLGGFESLIAVFIYAIGIIFGLVVSTLFVGMVQLYTLLFI